MEICVNEYVRTTNKGIKRIDNIDNNKTVNKYLYCIGEDWDGKCYGFIKTTEILKHSPNIIDLIEEGDYVNGYKVIDVLENLETGELHLEMPMDYTNPELGDCTIYNKDIKDAVTKEQFNQMKYIVGDESNVKD